MAVWGLTIQRAVTWSITCDEAITYNTFLAGNWHHLLLYGANNHILFTWLAKGSVTLFGLTAWSLRLPAMIATALYLACVAWLARRWFGGPWQLLVVGLLTINPLMMDYWVAARGYGLACAFLLMAEVLVLQPTELADTTSAHKRWANWRRYAISTLCSLSVVTNLAFISAAAAVFCVALWREHRRYWLQLILPGAILAGLVLGPYFHKIANGKFGLGFASLRYTAVDLWEGSLHHEALAQTAYIQVVHRIVEPVSVHSTSGVLAAIAMAMLLGICVARCTAQCIWKRSESLSPGTAAAMAFALAVFFIVLLHKITHLPYPVQRTALYLLPMGTLAILLMAIEAAPVIRRSVAIFAITLLAIYARQIRSNSFEYARYDAGAKALFAAMEADANGHFHRPVHLGGTWIYEPAMNFYRAVHHANWLLPMERDYGHPQPSQYDYFVAHPLDYPDLNWNAYRLVASDTVSGTRLIALLNAPAIAPTTMERGR